MNVPTIDPDDGSAVLRCVCLHKLRSLGVDEEQARQMAADESGTSMQPPVLRALPDDQRVFPHARGWLVTRDFEARGAHFFQSRAEAERHARRAARESAATGILFYDEDGRAIVYVDYPDWR